MCISLQEYDRTAPNQNILKQRQTSAQVVIALFCDMISEWCCLLVLIFLGRRSSAVKYVLRLPWSLQGPASTWLTSLLLSPSRSTCYLTPWQGPREVRPRSGPLDEVAVTAGVEVVVVAVAEGGEDAALAGTTWATPSLPVLLALELDF